MNRWRCGRGGHDGEDDLCDTGDDGGEDRKDDSGMAMLMRTD